MGSSKSPPSNWDRFTNFFAKKPAPPSRTHFTELYSSITAELTPDGKVLLQDKEGQQLVINIVPNISSPQSTRSNKLEVPFDIFQIKDPETHETVREDNKLVLEDGNNHKNGKFVENGEFEGFPEAVNALIEWSIAVVETREKSLKRGVTPHEDSKYFPFEVYCSEKERMYYLVAIYQRSFGSAQEFQSVPTKWVNGELVFMTKYISPITTFSRAHLWKYLFDSYSKIQDLAQRYAEQAKLQSQIDNDAKNKSEQNRLLQIENEQILKEKAEKKEKERLDSLFPQPRVSKNVEARVEAAKAEAEKGDPVSQCSLGAIYANGTEVEKDPVEAVKWFRKSADQGNPVAETWLGNMYASGTGITKDPAEAVKWYRKAADQGDAIGQINLGAMYVAGTDVPKDLAEAARWFRKAANQGNSEAQKWLDSIAPGLATTGPEPSPTASQTSGHSDNLSTENMHTEFDRERNRIAAESGDAVAQNLLGVMYADGTGVSKDPTEALKWFRKAADQGNANAQINLDAMYANGKGIENASVKAGELFPKAADQGNVDAVIKAEQNRNAETVQQIRDAATSGDRASQFVIGKEQQIREAAEGGDPAAQFLFGKMNVFGWGIAKDPGEAAIWYLKSAEQGYALAQNNLGLMYLGGEGFSKDVTLAVKWLRRAAEQGYVLGQFNLAMRYARGEGVAKNDTEAAIWYRKAAEQGDADAIKCLETINSPRSMPDQNNSRASTKKDIHIPSGVRMELRSSPDLSASVVRTFLPGDTGNYTLNVNDSKTYKGKRWLNITINGANGWITEQGLRSLETP